MDVPNKLIVRNTVLNFFGLVVPLAVGFVSIPMVVRALGNERFGILALVWVVFGYFGLFDLGLGRTTTRYVADCLGRNDAEKLPGLPLDDGRASDGDRDRRRLPVAPGRACHRPAHPQHPRRLRSRDHPDAPPRRLVAAGHVRRLFLPRRPRSGPAVRPGQRGQGPGRTSSSTSCPFSEWPWASPSPGSSFCSSSPGPPR